MLAGDAGPGVARRAGARGDPARRPDGLRGADRVDGPHRRPAHGRPGERRRLRRLRRRTPGRRRRAARRRRRRTFPGGRERRRRRRPPAARPARPTAPPGRRLRRRPAVGRRHGRSRRRDHGELGADDGAEGERVGLLLGRGDRGRQRGGLARARDRARRSWRSAATTAPTRRSRSPRSRSSSRRTRSTTTSPNASGLHRLDGGEHLDGLRDPAVGREDVHRDHGGRHHGLRPDERSAGRHGHRHGQPAAERRRPQRLVQGGGLVRGHPRRGGVVGARAPRPGRSVRVPGGTDCRPHAGRRRPRTTSPRTARSVLEHELRSARSSGARCPSGSRASTASRRSSASSSSSSQRRPRRRGPEPHEGLVARARATAPGGCGQSAVTTSRSSPRARAGERLDHGGVHRVLDVTRVDARQAAAARRRRRGHRAGARPSPATGARPGRRRDRRSRPRAAPAPPRPSGRATAAS